MKDRLRDYIYELTYKIHAYFFSGHYKSIIELLVPNLFSLNKIKMGREGDGCYVLPDNFIPNNAILLSFGVADDISFEKDFLEKYPTTRIFTFDPSISTLPEENSSLYFKSIGIAGKNNKEKNLFTFKTIITDLNLSMSDCLMIKMDIEGWEWGVFENFDFTKKNIPLITIEFHFMTINSINELILFPYHFYKRFKTVKRILAHYYIFHLHANNYRYVTFKKFIFPWLAEITLISKKHFESSIKSDISKFNSINLKDRVDIQYPFMFES